MIEIVRSDADRDECHNFAGLRSSASVHVHMNGVLKLRRRRAAMVCANPCGHCVSRARSLATNGQGVGYAEG
jgi:hypothetical protein